MIDYQANLEIVQQMQVMSTALVAIAVAAVVIAAMRLAALIAPKL